MELAHILYEIRELLPILWVSSVHVLRSQIADKLANHGEDLSSIFIAGVVVVFYFSHSFNKIWLLVIQKNF